MSRTLVVSQPMFLPWIGLFEQVRLADVFIHYDDVQLPQGRSFISRVQVKSPNGTTWLTAPIDHGRSGKLIKDVVLFNDQDWRARHLRTLHHNYAGRPYAKVMLQMAEEIYANATDRLSEFNIDATERIAKWLGLSPRFLRSSELDVDGASTERLVGLCEATDCNVYVTGLGALKYLDHEQFDTRGISVRYMNYRKIPYEQGHGEFIPYVTTLDAIASCGDRARDLLCSDAVYWRDFNVS
jgi:WbqC-like protein